MDDAVFIKGLMHNDHRPEMLAGTLYLIFVLVVVVVGLAFIHP